MQDDNQSIEPEDRSDAPYHGDLETEHDLDALDRPSSRARNGKIARLPGDIREIVNQMIYDGDLYREIIVRLNELGHPGIRLQNLSEWRKGGFQDWRRDRLNLQNLDADRQALQEVVQDPKATVNVSQANELLLNLRLNRVLMDGKDEGDTPSPQFFQLARLVARQMHERTRRERLEFQRQAKAEPFEVLKNILKKAHAAKSNPSE
jgi:hypothetical protein